MNRSEYEKYLQGDHWSKVKFAAKKWAHYKCRQCKISEANHLELFHQHLEVHHLSYENIGHEGPSDVVVLCARCHDAETFGSLQHVWRVIDL